MKISDLTKSGELRNRPSLGMKIDRVDFGSWNQTSSLDETVIGSSYHLELSSISHANLCPVCL